MSDSEFKQKIDRKEFVFRNRKASKEENKVLIDRIDSLSEAAKLRNVLSDKSPENFHNPIEFSSRGNSCPDERLKLSISFKDNCVFT